MKSGPNSLDELDDRVTALCCRLYGIKSPAECRRLREAGEIGANDFFASLELAVRESPSTIITILVARLTNQGPPTPPLLEWLFPEPAEAQAEQAQASMNSLFDALLMQAKPADEKSAEALERLKAKKTDGK